MTQNLSAWIECGSSPDTATRLALELPKRITLAGAAREVAVDVFGEPYPASLRATPLGVQTMRLSRNDIGALANELALSLLSPVRGYRFAVTGIDPDEAYEILDFRDENPLLFSEGQYQGVILSESVANNIHRLKGFVPFSAGYVWRPHSSRWP
jgi:hypothetical protein